MSDDNWRREVDNKLISHDKDIHSIAQSVRSIDESVKKMAEIQVQQAVRDQHYSAQIKECKDIAVRAHDRIDEHDKDKKKLAWLFITPIIVALLGTVIYKSASQTDTNKQLQELTQAVQQIKNAE